jgi:DNA-binding CsgD family transcriptional regulator
LRDPAALLALPTIGLEKNPVDITMGLLAVLFAVLRLESAYVRFDDPAGGPTIERWQPDGAQMPSELTCGLGVTQAHERGTVTVALPAPSGDRPVHVTRLSPVLLGEKGLVLVSSRRHDFPTDLELRALRLTVDQAAVSIYLGRRLADERAARVAAETALRRRNLFLAELADDLTLPLGRLAVRAAQAHALATESDPPLVPASMADDRAMSAAVTPPPRADVHVEASSAPLTRREAEVLALLAQGLTNKEMAGAMWLSERTVERHITGLYRKIGVVRRSQATAFALLRQGLVEPDGHVG